MRDKNRGLRPERLLSRELILKTAMRLAETEQAHALTMTRLGKALGTDPTAVYRHFRNRDEFILALGDLLIGEAMVGIDILEDWATGMRELAWATRRSYLARPALAVEVAPRFTGGPHEQYAVDLILDVLQRAGLNHREAVRYARAFFESMLGHIGVTATMLSLPPNLQAADVAMVQRVYAVPNQASAPSLGRTNAGPSAEDEDRVFDTILEVFLSGLALVISDHAAVGRSRGRRDSTARGVR